jgi:hypothetical protein
MDCEKNDWNQETVDEEVKRQRAIQIVNDTKRQFASDCKRGLVTSSKEVPKLKDDTIGYLRLTWRLKKKWFAKGKCWFYGLQYKRCELFGIGIWKYIVESKTRNIKIKDETLRTDAYFAMKLAEGDPTFEGGVVWFKDRDLATAFIEVIEAHRRETLLNEYLQLHPENIYL